MTMVLFIFVNLFFFIFILFKTVAWIFGKDLDLRKKSVLITGASSGLGRCLAYTLHQQYGCHLHLCARNIQELSKMKEELHKLNEDIPVKVYFLDLSQLDEIEKFVNRLFDDGNNIDILINNAGVRFRGDIISTNYQVYQKIFDVNFFGQVELTNEFLKKFIKHKVAGHVVSVGSIQAKLSTPFRAPYSSSKHACQAYYDAVRAEMTSSNTGIKVTVVHPGYIKTNSSKNAILSDGSVSGKSEEEKGMTVEEVTQKIIESIIKQENEVLIAPFHHKAAMLIRLVSPNLYFWINQKRARKSS